MRVAVLGAGGMGEVVIKHLKECSLVSGIVAHDPRSARLEELQGLYGITPAATLSQILDDPAIRLVFVTAANFAHKELTIAALEAGKAVMCEKPMAVTLTDAEAMVEAAECTKGFLQIGFELRYSKLYTKVKQWIDQGLLGEIVHADCTYISSAYSRGQVWRTKGNGGGIFGEKLCHYVDLPRWWAGTDIPVRNVYAACSPNVIPYYDIHDNFQATYRFANGSVGHITFMMALAHHFDGDPLQDVIDQQAGDGHCLRFLIQGTKGAAATDVFGRHIKRWEFSDTSETFVSKWVEDLTWPAAEDHFYFHNTHDQAHDIVRRVAERLEPRISPRDALQTMRLCFAAEDSARTGSLVHLAEPRRECGHPAGRDAEEAVSGEVECGQASSPARQV